LPCRLRRRWIESSAAAEQLWLLYGRWHALPQQKTLPLIGKSCLNWYKQQSGYPHLEVSLKIFLSFFLLFTIHGFTFLKAKIT
jgi:hypothetical protein